jgi:hypothetical protein
LIIPAEHPGDAFLASVAHELAERFGIAHATLQIEDGSCAECCLAPATRGLMQRKATSRHMAETVHI